MKPEITEQFINGLRINSTPDNFIWLSKENHFL